MNALEFKNKFKTGRVYGTAITSMAPMWPVIIEKAKLDFVFLDTEHIIVDKQPLSAMCNVYKSMGILPIVRIPSPLPDLATNVLDGGAMGLLAPYVETVDQVKNLVGAVKYRPLKGEKLKQILDDPASIDSKLKEYVDDRCKYNLLFINIESKPALDNLPELLDVPGLDGVIIGPHDLSCSLDVPEEYTNPVFENAVSQIIRECKKRDLGIGMHLSEGPEYQMKWGKEGLNIILHSSDAALFLKMLNHDMSKIKSTLNDKVENNDNQIII